jgi:hypothetical protein
MQIPKASTERPAALEGFLLGPEAVATPGLVVPANIRLRSFKVRFKQEGNVEGYDSAGSWLMTRYVQGTEWASAPYSGWASFTEDHLVYNSTFGPVTPVTVGTTGKKRTWQIDPFAAVDPTTYSMAAGQAARGELYPCAFFNGFKISLNKQSNTKSGTILSQALVDNTAIEAAPSLIAMEPMLPKFNYVKFATTLAGLAGATKFRRTFDIGFEFSNFFGLMHPVVDDNISFDGLVQKMPTVALTLQTNKLATAMAWLTDLRASNVIYYEIGNVGRQFEGGGTPQSFSWKLQVATQVSAPFDDATAQDVVGVNWKFGAVPADDMTAGPIKLELINNIA